MCALALGLVELDDAGLRVCGQLLHACVLGDDRGMPLHELGLLALELVRAETQRLLAALDVLDLCVDERLALGCGAAGGVGLLTCRPLPLDRLGELRAQRLERLVGNGRRRRRRGFCNGDGDGKIGLDGGRGRGVGLERLENGDLVDDLVRRRHRLDAALALEERAQARSESGLGLVRRHFSTLMMLRRAGPSTTTNIDGKMKSTVGKSILIGAFIAFSSAAAWRRRRESAAWTRRMRPSEMPS